MTNYFRKIILVLFLFNVPPALAASLELQGQCARQALVSFKESGSADNPAAVYANHYDEASKKCFVAIQNTLTDSKSETIWTTETISDAFEGMVYATYLWHTVKDKKYWEVEPVMCQVKKLSGEELTCHSNDEFNDLVHKQFGLSFK